MANICVFCSSSDNLDKKYQDAAVELGALIGNRKHTLIYGGSNRGLMGKLARSAQANSGKVIGVLPEIFNHLAHGEDELMRARDLRHRKSIMEEKSDGFIILPGGWGTLDELGDILVALQLQIHQKPLVIINTDGFYDLLLQYFKMLEHKGFSPQDNSSLYHVVSTPQDALNYIEQNIK